MLKDILYIDLSMTTNWDKWPKKVKVTHGKGRCVINIPAELARRMGLDKADYALIAMNEPNKLEVRTYNGPEDYKEYV